MGKYIENLYIYEHTIINAGNVMTATFFFVFKLFYISSRTEEMAFFRQ